MIRVFFLYTIFLFLFTPVWSDQSSARKDAEAVQQLINEQEFENAIARVDAALSQHKKDERLLLQRGFILVQLNQLEAAQKHYKKLKRKLKNNPEPGNNLAMVYRLQGEYAEAVELFKDTIEKFPDYAQAYENLGDTYIEMAQKEYQRGVDNIPDHELLTSKASISQSFNQISTDNTPSGKRRALAASQATSENTAAESANHSGSQPTVTPLRSPSDQVTDTLRSWVTTWSNRDVDNFLAHYSREFVPADGLGLPEWIGKRTEELSSTDFIKVRLNEIRITQSSADLIIANFIQEYETDSVNNRSLKSLTLKFYQDRWLILKEESRPLKAG